MTIDFIPVEFYTPVYYYSMFVIVLFTVLHTQVLELNNEKNLKFIRSAAIFLLFFVLIYIGLRPISGVFIDMTTYSKMFHRIQKSEELVLGSDFIFDLFMFVTAKTVDVTVFFLICAILYILPLFLASKKWFRGYAFYAFLILVISFSFWNYATNGIRNGIATSLFILAISREKKISKILWLTVAVGFHQSIILPTLAYLFTYKFNHSKYYLTFWLLCIPISYFAGNFFETAFSNLGFADDRLSKYLTDEEFGANLLKGFRWDFLLYSSTGTIVGWYFIFKKNLADEFYCRLYNVYLLSNGFWILVITASFSNRFAYLSWFLLGLVVIYPLLKHSLFPKQNRKIGIVILGYFLFTFFMNVIIA